MSVTVYQDGPDLANQGTLVAAQMPLVPLKYGTTGRMFAADPSYLMDVPSAPIEAYETTDLPNFDVLQSMPNAYFGRSKEGAYIPLKLTKTCQQWHGVNDLVLQHAETITPTDLGEGLRGWITMPIVTEPSNASFPHVNLQAAFSHHTDPGVLAPAVYGDATSPLCNDTAAHFCARNLAATTSYSFFVRAGYEVQVQPGSIYSTHLKLSPPHDPLALASYFAIARELKDAYPADHNDLGKIWDVISTVAKSVAPALTAVPGIGVPLAGAVSGVATAGDAIRAAVSRSKRALAPRSQRQDQPSLADKELARQFKAGATGTLSERFGRTLSRPQPRPPRRRRRNVQRRASTRRARAPTYPF